MSLVLEGTEFWISPGSKNVAGETPYEVLMPLHPLPSRQSPASPAAIAFAFQTNFTPRTIITPPVIATPKSAEILILILI